MTFSKCSKASFVIGKNVKQELKSCLKLRNAAGHPNGP